MPGTPVFAVSIAGREYSRWAQNVMFSSVDPGGYEMCSIDIHKDSALRVNPGDKIRIYDGSQVVWEGRVAEPQKSIKHAVAATLIGGEGYGAALKDNQMSMVYLDRDMTRWGSASTTRISNLSGSNFEYSGPVMAPDTANGFPTVSCGFTGNWNSPFQPFSEALYDAGQGNGISAISFDVTFLNSNFGGSFFSIVGLLNTDDVTSVVAQTANLSPGTQQILTSSVSCRYGLLQYRYTATPAGTPGQLFQANFKNVTVYGNHGLPLQGSTYPKGLYAYDIAQDAIKRAIAAGAPLRLGIIDTITNPLIQHYVQYTPVAHEQIVADMQKQAACHYGTWESQSPFDDVPRTDFRAYPTQPTAFCSLADCDEIDLSERLSALYNRVLITWQDAAGRPFNSTIALPLDLLDQNQLVRTATYNLGTSSAAVAQTFGIFVLQLLYAQQRGAGSVTLPRRVRTSSGALIPAHWLKAGLDRLRINDLPFRTGLIPAYDTDAFRISRVECQVGADGIPVTRVELDQGPNLIETLTARLEIATKIAGG